MNEMNVVFFGCIIMSLLVVGILNISMLIHIFNNLKSKNVSTNNNNNINNDTDHIYNQDVINIDNKKYKLIYEDNDSLNQSVRIYYFKLPIFKELFVHINNGDRVYFGDKYPNLDKMIMCVYYNNESSIPFPDQMLYLRLNIAYTWEEVEKELLFYLLEEYPEIEDSLLIK